MRYEFPGRCPGLVYDALSGLFLFPRITHAADYAYLPSLPRTLSVDLTSRRGEKRCWKSDAVCV